MNSPLTVREAVIIVLKAHYNATGEYSVERYERFPVLFYEVQKNFKKILPKIKFYQNKRSLNLISPLIENELIELDRQGIIAFSYEQCPILFGRFFYATFIKLTDKGLRRANRIVKSKSLTSIFKKIKQHVAQLEEDGDFARKIKFNLKNKLKFYEL